MRAVRVVRNGDPLEVVEVQEVPVPEPDPGSVLVQVSAASINFGDIARCRGGVASVMAQPPFTLGMDVCGTVDGRRVVAMCAQSLGGMAEWAVCPTNGVFDAPAELDDVEAAAFLLPFHTTWLAIHQRAKLRAGEHLLVVGGASALGTAAIQLGVAAGAHVIAAVGDAAKAEVCTGLGASAVVDRSQDDVFDRVLELTGGHGADVCVDMVGGDGTEAVWSAMAWEGRYVPVGFNDDPQSGLTGRPLRKVSMGNFSVHGVMLGYNEAPELLRKFGVHPNPPSLGPVVHAALCELVTAGRIRPAIGRVIRMDDVAQALSDHEHRRTTGRTVVDVAAG